MKVRFGKKKLTLMNRLIKYFLIIIALMFSLFVYSSYGFKSFYSNFYIMLKQLFDIHSISLEVDTLYQQLDNYAHSGTGKYIEEYKTGLSRLKKRIEILKDVSSDQAYFKCRDIENILLTFDEVSRNMIKRYEERMPQIYVNQSVTELAKIKGYVHDEVKNLLLIKLLSAQSYYFEFGNTMGEKENLIYVLMVFITLLCIVFAFRFSRTISMPIHQLVLRLEKVAQGELNVEQVALKSNDEVGILVDSFNFMLTQIKNLIDTIKVKADVEKKLQEQEIKNLEISNLLNQSELQFLQSQINPHFLFNTMNTIAVLADIEDAPKTKMLLESMSDILRYNLKSLDETVLLSEEYEIAKNYLYIQKARFDSKIEYILDIDEGALSYKVPSMILQPFIENAIIHGLEPKEGKGVLELIIRETPYDIQIIIRDNGVGISQERLAEILNYKEKSQQKSSRYGIGISNVMRRLELKYGKNVVDIYSKLGKGTEVRMKLMSSSSVF